MKGKCLCGAIEYEVDKVEPNMAHCYCPMCRRFHGAAFSTFAEEKKENFRWLKGRELLVDYVASNGTVRQFYKICGSSMTFKSADDSGESIEFSLATLEGDYDLWPDAHVHVGSKVNWIEICDDLPQFKKGRS